MENSAIRCKILLYYGAVIFYESSVLVWTVFGIMILIRLLLAIGFKHHILISILFLPLTIIFGMIIAINSFYQSKFGSVYWKGRSVKLE